MLGSTRCNNLRRRLPRMSPSLLSKRLGELETAGLVFRQGRPRRQRVLLDSSREGASPARLGDRDVEGSKRRKTGTDKPKRDRRPNEGLAWPQPICSTKAKGRLVYVEAAIHGCHGIRNLHWTRHAAPPHAAGFQCRANVGIRLLGEAISRSQRRSGAAQVGRVP